MNVTFIGTGFVGVVSAAVYASFGNQVIGLDVDKKKIELLKKNIVPFYEPNLEELLKAQQENNNLIFTTDYKSAIKDADVIMIAVGTPSAPDGQADLKYVFASAESLAPHIKENVIVAIKSTVPPGTLEKVEAIIKSKTKTKFYTASVPEFLKEGSAVYDTLNPDRAVIGATSDYVFEKLEELHKPLNTEIVKVKPESAQMAKYAANAYLATRITFINQIADLCEKNGADVNDIVKAIGFDKRIGKHYWYPGLGYGGSCFPKDVKELAAYSKAINESGNLFIKINELNEERIPRLLNKFEEKVGRWENKKIAILGISFKPNTDDMREAPSTKIIPILLNKGASVKSYDPMASWKEFFRLESMEKNHQQVKTIDEAVKDADIVFSLIEWPEIIKFDFASANKDQKEKWFIDARNQFNQKVIEQNYKYLAIGKQTV